MQVLLLSNTIKSFILYDIIHDCILDITTYINSVLIIYFLLHIHWLFSITKKILELSRILHWTFQFLFYNSKFSYIFILQIFLVTFASMFFFWFGTYMVFCSLHRWKKFFILFLGLHKCSKLLSDKMWKLQNPLNKTDLSNKQIYIC